MTLDPVYIQWKEIMDDMYSGSINCAQAAIGWSDILNRQGIKSRPNHNLKIYSYFVYDKEEYSAPNRDKPLGLGIVYTKPNGLLTQDIIIVHPEGGLEIYHNERQMVRKYPSMKGVHKENLPQG